MRKAGYFKGWSNNQGRRGKGALIAGARIVFDKEEKESTCGREGRRVPSTTHVAKRTSNNLNPS